MTYQPKIGQYGTLSTGTFSSFFIQLGTACKDDHVVVYAGNGMVLEATPSKGIVLSPLSRYANHKIAWNKCDDITEEEGALIVAEGMKHLHDGYSFLAIALIVLRILHVTSDRFMFDRMRKSDKAICSAYAVVLYYNAIGKKLSDKPAWLTTPADLTYRMLY